MEKYLNKCIYAYDKGCKYRNIGIIKNIDDKKVEIFCNSNPNGYKFYSIDTKMFLKWIEEKLYKIRKVKNYGN